LTFSLALSLSRSLALSLFAIMLCKPILAAALIACASAGTHAAGKAAGRSRRYGSTRLTGDNATTGGNVTVAAGTTTAAASTASVAAPTAPTHSKKEKARATLKGKRDALNGAFDDFMKNKCGATATMTCTQLKAALEANKKEAKAVFAKLKTARTKCKDPKPALFRGEDAQEEAAKADDTDARNHPSGWGEVRWDRSLSCPAGLARVMDGDVCRAGAAQEGTPFRQIETNGYPSGCSRHSGESVYFNTWAGDPLSTHGDSPNATQHNAEVACTSQTESGAKGQSESAQEESEETEPGVRLARESHAAADDADIAELSCIELETEITTLKAQAAAAGLDLEASTGDAGTTTLAVPGSASQLAAGATAVVAVAVALLC